MKRSILFPLAIAIFVGAGAAKAQIIVVNHSVKADAISKSELRDIFLGASTNYKDGSRAVPALLKGGAVHEKFLKEYVGKSETSFRAAWRTLSFSGQGTIPQSFDSESALIDYVAKVPGAIGYIAESTNHEKLKLLAVGSAPTGNGNGNGNDLAVVINKANGAGNLTKAQLRKLVLGEQPSWVDGTKVTMVLGAPGSPERNAVLRAVCRMSEEEYVQHTAHASADGESIAPPKVIGSAEGIRQMVAGAPGAIGFLRLSDVNDSVKVLSVDGILAGQPDYKIKTDH